MIIGASKKFLRHYKIQHEVPPVMEKHFPQTWSLDMISNGRQQLLVLATEQVSLFNIIIPCTHSRNLQQLIDKLQKRLEMLFRDFDFYPDFSTWSFCRRTDPRFIGSQNDFIKQVGYQLPRFARPIPFEDVLIIEQLLNMVPMGWLRMQSPEQRFAIEIDKLRRN